MESIASMVGILRTLVAIHYGKHIATVVERERTELNTVPCKNRPKPVNFSRLFHF